MQNVAVMLKDEISERGIKPSAVRALHEKNCAIFQISSSDLRRHSTQLWQRNSG
jgi:hypothetical protein